MKKLILMLILCLFVIPGFSQYFKPGFTGSGTDQMLLLVTGAEINSVPLQAGDEIAVFDGNLCCGVYELTQPINPGDALTFVELNASPDDGEDGSISDGSPNGFTQGNKIYLRFWDSSAGVEYHNVIVQFYDTDKNPIAAQTFQESSTAYITASTANTEMTWVGEDPDFSTSWSSSLNWSPEGIPEINNDVIIPSGFSPIISTNDKASCGSLTFEDNLTVSSANTSTGSLIVAGSISGSNGVRARRYLTKDVWHFVSSPLPGQTIASFLSGTATSIIPANSGNRGMMDYSELNDNWNSFFTNTSPGNIIAGKGYCLRVTHATNPGNTITFSGSLQNGNVSTPVTTANFGWNLIGNPYPSAIYVRQEVFGFLVQNDAVLVPSFKALYLWDPTANSNAGGYTVVNFTEGQANLAYGQGFFIKAASPGGSVTFTKQMQVHQTDAPFKSAVIKWPSLVLNAKAGDISSSTKILFNEK
jgi:hypothetical protein